MNFKHPNLHHGFSSKKDGAMNLKFSSFVDKNIQNRKIYFNRLRINPSRLVSADLVHGHSISIVTEKHLGQILPHTDGLITNQKNIVLTVTAADCLPIYFYDSKKKVIGLAHAGWRGVVQNIASALIKKMISTFQSSHSNILAYIGPHLQKCHFEVKNDVASQFDPAFISHKNNLLTVDLLSAIKKQLTEIGLKPTNITASPDCTYCHPEKYFSFRHDQPTNLETMIAYLELK